MTYTLGQTMEKALEVQHDTVNYSHFMSNTKDTDGNSVAKASNGLASNGNQLCHERWEKRTVIIRHVCNL